MEYLYLPEHLSVEVPYDDSLVAKAVQASHYQGSKRYGNS